MEQRRTFRLFKRKSQPAPTAPPMDLHERARPELERRAVDNPRLAALLAEVDRGRERREPLHAHEITPDDAVLIRMMAGAHFDDAATMTLPSGRTISGAEMRRWVETEGAPGE